MAATPPAVSLTPGVEGGKPCIAGTTLPIAAVTACYTAAGLDETLRRYPQLHRGHVLVACWFQTVWTEVKHRGWQEWVREHAKAIQAQSWDRVADPPRFDQSRRPMSEGEIRSEIDRWVIDKLEGRI
ncbi:MAG: hypothetical protein CL878_11185 [Dehalococcoidia bacterium]|nr:hypothetical protein [Dehalococcoidia bacterium]